MTTFGTALLHNFMQIILLCGHLCATTTVYASNRGDKCRTNLFVERFFILQADFIFFYSFGFDADSIQINQNIYKIFNWSDMDCGWIGSKVY